jgi:hypothetical protein
MQPASSPDFLFSPRIIGRRHTLGGTLAGGALLHSRSRGIRWKPAGLIYSVDICLLRDFTIIKKYGLEPDLDNFINPC